MDKVELTKVVSGLHNPGSPEVIVTPENVIVADKPVAKVFNGTLTGGIELDHANVMLDDPLVIAFDARTTGAAITAVLDAVAKPGMHLTLLARVVHETVGQSAEYGMRDNERADAPNINLHHDKAELTANDGTRQVIEMRPADPIDESVELGMAVSAWKDAHAAADLDTMTLTLFRDATAADLLIASDSLREKFPRFVIVRPR